MPKNIGLSERNENLVAIKIGTIKVGHDNHVITVKQVLYVPNLKFNF